MARNNLNQAVSLPIDSLDTRLGTEIPDEPIVASLRQQSWAKGVESEIFYIPHELKSGSLFWKTLLSEYYAELTDTQLRSVQLWVENSDLINSILHRHDQLLPYLISEDDSQINVFFEAGVDLLSHSELEAVFTAIVEARSLLNITKRILHIEHESFLLRGQTTDNRIHTSTQLERFTSVSSELAAACVHCQKDTEILAVYVPRDSLLTAIPIANNLRELGLETNHAVLRGLKSYSEGYNLGGYRTYNYEFLMPPGIDLQVSPNVTVRGNLYFRAAVVSDQTLTNTDWSVIERKILSFLTESMQRNTNACKY